MTDFNSNLTTILPANIVVPQVSDSFDEIIQKLKDASSEFSCIANINSFLKKDSSLLTHQDEEGNTLLHYAAFKGFYETLIVLLLKGADTTIPNKAGYTPLILISQLSNITDNHYTCIERLLSFACENQLPLINIADNQGFTALHFAVSFYNIKLVELLLEAGADFNQEDNWGWSPLFMVASSGPYLRSDISHQDSKEMAALFIKKGARMDERGINNMTVLHCALQREEKSFIEHAINEANNNRFDMNLQDDNGLTPLDYLANKLSFYNENLKISNNFLKDFPLMNQFIDALNLFDESSADLENGFTLFQVIEQIVEENSSQLLLISQNLEAIKSFLLSKLLMLLSISNGSFTEISPINSTNQDGMTLLDCAISTLNFLNEEKKRNETYKKQMQIVKFVFSSMLAAGAKLNKMNWETLASPELIGFLGLEPNFRDRYYLESERLQIEMGHTSLLKYSFFNASKEASAIEKVLKGGGVSEYLKL